jgi:hypothetical protein
MVKNMLLCIMLNVLKNNRNPEVLAGVFLIVASISISTSYLTKIEFLSLFSSLTDDFEYITDNVFILRLNAILWIITSFLMILVSASLLFAMKVHKEITAYITAFFFVITSFLFCMTAIKSFSIFELLVYQESKILNPLENESVRAHILNLTEERSVIMRISFTLAGSGLLFLGFFGADTKRIPFIIRMLCIIGGIMLPFASIFFPKSILNEVGLLIFLFVFLVLGLRIAFKGFVKRKKRKTIEKSKDEIA